MGASESKSAQQLSPFYINRAHLYTRDTRETSRNKAESARQAPSVEQGASGITSSVVDNECRQSAVTSLCELVPASSVTGTTYVRKQEGHRYQGNTADTRKYNYLCVFC